MPTYCDESRPVVMARQFTGLKISKILTTHPSRFGNSFKVFSRSTGKQETFWAMLLGLGGYLKRDKLKELGRK